MKAAIIVSRKDNAAMNIKRQLLADFDFVKSSFFKGHDVFSTTVNKHKIELYTVEEESIYCENLDTEIAADTFIFATKHQSSAGRKSLTTHVQGNWGKAEMGGKGGKLAIAAAPMIKEGLRILSLAALEKKLDYEVVQEVTHHGPYLEKPSMFIEIGSSEKEYGHIAAGKAVASAIIGIFERKLSFRTAVGIGGLHYALNFKSIALNTGIAIGHICPKYALGELDEEMLQQAIEKTWPRKAELVIVDWKGLGEHKEKVVKLIEECGVPWKKTKELNVRNF